jgi:cytoskeletal protein CcmA (bactofilin family)
MCLNFDNYMFGSNNKDKFFSERKDSERSLISETVSIDGTVNSSGAIDIAGLIKGPVFSKEIVIKETGSISGEVEADNVEIHGHLDGKISAQNVVIGSTGVVKGDIEFANNLKTEEGADIEGYIKKNPSIGKSESKSSGDFLFSKSSDEKKHKKNGKPSTAVNKDSEILA